jgi:di/tricarboxylate transporter
VGVFSKVSYALLIFAGAILLSMWGILPTTVSFTGAILAYVFSGILPVRDLYKSIDWSVIVLLGAMIPLSNALQSTGATTLIADHVGQYDSIFASLVNPGTDYGDYHVPVGCDQ